jgi:Secretion system C-terminal sorting domain
LHIKKANATFLQHKYVLSLSKIIIFIPVMIKSILSIFLAICLLANTALAQQSVARQWNELHLSAIRKDLARPPVQARHLFHVTMAMYDAWAAYDNNAQTYLLGKTINGVTYPFTGIPPVAAGDVEAAREKALSFAVYRVLYNRYIGTPAATVGITSFRNKMTSLGYDYNFISEDYTTGDPAALGNYIGAQIIAMGMADNSRQAQNYSASTYLPVNTQLSVLTGGNPVMQDPNSWQPLYLTVSIDQSGNPVNSLQKFICPEWGKVRPFALDTATASHFIRNGFDYITYDDPGAPPQLSLTDAANPSSLDFKWGMEMVAAWSSHLDPNDTTTMDISPRKLGNILSYPNTIAGMRAFYNYENGGENNSTGYATNPFTSLPYTPQRVKRGDYARIVAQYWADGPASETPPGHWFTLLNYVSDQPECTKRLGNVGAVLNNLEWDVKTYFILGGGVHDAAIAAWGLKGRYDAARPVSAIRRMAELGQSSDILLPSYHPGGLRLKPGFVELIAAGDPLAGVGNINVNKIKIKAWRGYDFIINKTTDVAGAGWILATNWLPYQRSTFVTPPFAGFVSGHSTYSRAGAEIMTLMTGSPYFPRGLGEYVIPANSNFIDFEANPTTEVRLQWATYRDASDQASLSRIWGGIHPAFDDMPGRLIGAKIGVAAYNKAQTYFRSGGTLPITLIHFGASLNKNNTVDIKWITESELNNKLFVIECSVDGINFKNIHEAAGAGTTNNTRIYDFTDKNPPSGMVYYRLRQIDFDGTTTTSKTVAVRITDKNGLALTISPNPVRDFARLNVFSETAQTANLTVVNTLGQTFINKTITVQEGNNTETINTDNLSIGVYYVTLRNADGSYITQAFVK